MKKSFQITNKTRHSKIAEFSLVCNFLPLSTITRSNSIAPPMNMLEICG